MTSYICLIINVINSAITSKQFIEVNRKRKFQNIIIPTGKNFLNSILLPSYSWWLKNDHDTELDIVGKKKIVMSYCCSDDYIRTL